jgi:dTDP-4-amino-4,6-dideoxygalactose transaminase
MWVRKRLDIGWSDLGFAVARSLWPSGGDAAGRQLGDRDALACLSVRSGFDLLLAALELPAASEILMSALTIPDMARIVEHHGLVPVPVDLDPATLAPTPETIRSAITPAARMVVVAHLFGSRVPMGPILDLARSLGLLCVEDCAQAFDGRHFGHPDSDASLLSFGPIKTATALGGGLVRTRDAELLRRMRSLQAAWPMQGRGAYLRRVGKYACLKVISSRLMVRGLIRACELSGRDFDRIANSSARGFAGHDFFLRIRQQPSAPLLASVARRLRRFDAVRLAGRIAKGQMLARLLAGHVPCPAAHTVPHTYWVFPILAENPAEVIAALRRSGFDATQGASMFIVPPPCGRPDLRARVAEAAFSRIVYLPLYPEMPERAVRRMADVVLETAEAVSLPAEKVVSAV